MALWRSEFCAVISVARFRVGYFLEDRAQEGFLKAIVRRIAREVHLELADIEHDVRSPSGEKGRRGGRGQAITEFRAFLRESAKSEGTPFDILIVAIDGNCKGFNHVEAQLRKYADNSRYPLADDIVFAIPDPHIERWYLDDSEAFKKSVRLDSPPYVPKPKCEKDIYKRALEQNLRAAGISSLLGGPEYAETIVENMQDLYSVGKVDPSFGHFLDNLKLRLRVLTR